MLDPNNIVQLNKEIMEAIDKGSPLLGELRQEVKQLQRETRQIRPQSTTSISLVGTDGGNNQISYDPFLIQIIRVVDSNSNQYCLEALTHEVDLDRLSKKHETNNTSLWRLVEKLNLDSIKQLSPVFKKNIEERSKSWIQVYREITEWAILLDLLEKDYGTDTLIVFDGFIRSKMFAHGLFGKFINLVKKAIEEHYEKNRRKIYIVGLAKHTQVLECYRLAMALEGTMRQPYACYAVVPEIMKARAYQWSESYQGGGRWGKLCGWNYVFR